MLIGADYTADDDGIDDDDIDDDDDDEEDDTNDDYDIGAVTIIQMRMMMPKMPNFGY